MRLNKEKELKHQARRMSIKEGAFSTLRVSFCDSYVTPFAVAINASNSLIGLITSISGLLGPISQWFSSRLIEKYPRKKIVVTSTLYESLMWIPLMFVAVLFSLGILTSILPLVFLLFFSFYVLLANVSGPAWFSWVGDLVDDSYRGKWFSKRNYTIGIINLFATISAAFFLDFLSTKGLEMYGFVILFILGMGARLIARSYFNRSYEPKLDIQKDYYFSFWEFLRKAPNNNFGRYTLFRATFSFALSIASPFFAVYMLRELGFGYVTYMAVIMFQALFGLAVMKHWGNFADKHGNYIVMKITFISISIYPLFWLFSSSPLYLILVPELIGGIAWAGFNLSGSNFIFDSVTPQKRGLVISYFNLLNGIGIFLGAGLGSILVKTLSITFMNKLLFLFIISAIARLIVGLIMIPYISEVRNVEKFDSSEAIKNIVPFRRVYNLFEGTYEILARKRFNWRK